MADESEVKRHLLNSIPAVIVGVIFMIGSIGTIAVYGTPWESKEKADAMAALFQEELKASNEKLAEVANLNNKTADKLDDLGAKQAVQAEKQAEEDRRIEMLESWHRK